ncbi:lipopolysaccharide transport periplasmic protein LptA [Isoalcanivorax indicus]|uniref:lipopolysaccharide transport periplasmic protein LptA n=1 Tax=Isoalcanivorax indicus TaxID=2202653 RepID=UPI000DB9797E|nr:lipopolysaccharide transport periplasmic protein LptA [Isoalcanivorax indicus]
MTRPDFPIARAALIGLLALLALPAAAQEAVISADRAVFRQETGIGVYEGNAEMMQGERRLNAERIELTMKDGELTRVVATGAPVRLREGADIHARASRLVYDVAAQTITLSGDAHIENRGRRFQGARVVYNLSTRDIEASGDGAEQRVRLVIPAEDSNRETQP